MNKKTKLKYHHLGIPTTKPIEGEVYLKDYKVYHFGYEKSSTLPLKGISLLLLKKTALPSCSSRLLARGSEISTGFSYF